MREELLLPAPLSNVTVPTFFSPSRFPDLLGCKLAVIGEKEAHVRMPPSAEAVLGSILHHLRREWAEGLYAQGASASEAVSNSLETMAEQADMQLGRVGGTAHGAPLREALGWRAWAQGARRLKRWISGAQPGRRLGHPRALPNIVDLPARSVERTEPELQTGQEAWIVSPQWRLAGRADQVVTAPDGHFEIVDFKSGQLFDSEGELLAELATQVRLYALAAEESTHQPIRLFLEGSERREVPWDHRERADVSARLQEILSDLPQGMHGNAYELASPGPQCARCRVRPQCQRYLDSAPTLWRDPRIAGFLPLDTWGRVVTIGQSGAAQTIELRDPNNDLIVVRGLDTDGWANPLQPDDSIYLFGLERTENRRSHGLVSRPRNFHERPPDGGRRLRRAEAPLVFIGREDRGNMTGAEVSP